MKRVNRARRHQHGQVLIIIALAAVVLFGSTALAISLSADTQNRRVDQNSSDAGALAGARDLNFLVTPTSQNAAVTDALKAVGVSEGWTSSPSTQWWTSTSGAVPGAVTATYNNFTVMVEVPAQDAVAGSICNPATIGGAAANCVEVSISASVPNAFGAMVGAPNTTVASRSIAYHYGPGTAFPVALYASSGVLSANSPEIVAGDVYVGQYYYPQSSGQAMVCAAVQSGNPNSGHLLFGSPQPPASYPAPALVPAVVTYLYSQATGSKLCSDLVAGTSSFGRNPNGLFAETDGPPTGSCDIGGWSAPAGPEPSNTGGSEICVVDPALSAPQQTEPLSTSGTNTYPLAPCSMDPATLNAATYPPGVYRVSYTGTCGHNPDLTINLENGATLNCYSFVLDPGVTVQLSTTSTGGTINAYYNPGTCAGAWSRVVNGTTINGTDYAAANIFWTAPTSAVTIQDSGNGFSGNPSYTLNGSIYAPYWNTSTNSGSQVITSKNTAIYVNGQAIVGQWSDKGGAHPGPVVTWNQNNSGPIDEVERLVQ